MTIFLTERTLLRPMTDADYRSLRELDTDPPVVHYLGHGQVRSEDETRANMAKVFEDYTKYDLGLYIVEDRATRKFLGRAGLIPWIIDDGLIWEVGYTLKPSAWGQGLATEIATYLATFALKELKRGFVISLIHPENKRSIRVAEKVGLRFWKFYPVEGRELSIYRKFAVSEEC